jgi:HlyD family secretion protein
MNKARNYLVAGIIIALLVFSGYTIILLTRHVAMEVQGEIEATQVKVSSKVPGRIDSLPVVKGQDVKKGDLIFTINSPELEAKLAQASAARSAAQAQSQKAINGAQVEDIAAALNTWNKAKAAAELAEKTYNRVENLFNDGVVPEQKRDEAKTQMIAAKETSDAAKEQYEKAVKGAREEDKQAAFALVQQAQGVVSEVTSYLNETRITATISGEIANVLAEQGELVPTGYPVVTLVDLTTCHVVFNLPENLLADIRKGDELKAKIPALGLEDVAFKITYISALGDYATRTATKTSGDFDMKTFEINAYPVSPVEGLRPGMSVLVNWDKVKENRK